MHSLPENLRLLLQKAGLSEAEIVVYMELLKEPAATKWEIVGRTGLNRNMIYRAFERLKDLDLVLFSKDGVQGLSVKNLADKLEVSQKDLMKTAEELRTFGSFLSNEWQENDAIEFLSDQQKILEAYIMMSEVPYGTCLDFGDLESYVPVLGGMEPVFKFRENRFNQGAKNFAICTTMGPFTQCMLRKKDLKNFKANIERVNVNFDNKWIIFSDTSDWLMYNDFSDKDNPLAVKIRSKVLATVQRTQFDYYAEKVERL